MHKYLIAMMITLCSHYIWGQSVYFSQFTKLDTIIELPINEHYLNMNNFHYSSDKSNIYFTYFNASKQIDTIIFFTYNIKEESINKSKLLIPNLCKKLTSHYYSSIEFILSNEDWIIIGIFDEMYFFNKEGKLITIEPLKYYTTFAKFLDSERILLAENYNFNSKKKPDTYLGIYNVETFSFDKLIFPRFKVIQYTQIAPNHWFDVKNEKVIFSQTIEYFVTIYDNNLNEVGSIDFTDSAWRKVNEDVLGSNSIKRKSGIEAITELLKYENNVSRIRQVHFINDTTILVYSQKMIANNIEFTQEYVFDILKYQNCKWVFYRENLKDEFQNGKITNENYPIFKDKLSREMIIFDSLLFTFNLDSPIYPTGLSRKDYVKESNDYFFDNSPSLMMSIYSLNLRR